ncbi:hypothetical protein BHM03_00027192 [Ensete ventricosum]|nr:hypothetical protein BHM03_00027192 [Ensete ventricosum]
MSLRIQAKPSHADSSAKTQSFTIFLPLEGGLEITIDPTAKHTSRSIPRWFNKDLRTTQDHTSPQQRTLTALKAKDPSTDPEMEENEMRSRADPTEARSRANPTEARS